MKTTNPWRHATLTSLALVAGYCVLTTGPDTRFSGAAASSNKAPVFKDLSQTTAPPALMVQTSAPPAAPLAPAAAEAPAATPAPPAAPPVPAAAEAPAVTPAPPQPSPPPAASAPVEENTSGKTLYSFTANGLELRSALASFARANNLNIVPDNDVTGTVTLEVRDLALDQMMLALLEASDCTWIRQGGLIRVHSSDTRSFSVDYLRLKRKGTGQNSALLASGSSNNGSGGGGGVGGGGGGGGTSGSQGGSGYGSSSINLTADNSIDFWTELRAELLSILTEQGRQSLAMNMTAGIIQVSDRPSALKKVEAYLKGVDKSIHRQVDIEARIYSVTLNNQFQFGIDWVHVASAYGGLLGFGGSTLPAAVGSVPLGDSAVSGLNRASLIGNTGLGQNISSLVFSNFNTRAAVNALQEQGKVEVISKPRVRTLNNQTALIKVGEDVPFFNTSTLVQQSGTIQPLTSENVVVTSITIGTILSLTPQISDNDWISLDISPVLTSLKAVVNAPSATGNSGSSANNTSGTTAPDLETKQASTLVRVRDGNTVVLGGLIQTAIAKNVTKVPLLGDIPLLGALFRGTFEAKSKEELVIFVTPHIVREDEISAKVSQDEMNRNHRLIEPATDHPVRMLEDVKGPEWPQLGN